MGVDGGLGSWSSMNSHYSPRRCNGKDNISKEEGLELSLGEEISGHRSLETIQYYSISRRCHESSGHRSIETIHTNSSNHGVHGCRSSTTRHSAYHNRGGCVDIGGSRSQYTIHCSYLNWGT